MRHLIPLMLLLLAFTACQCGPSVATPVTLRIRNTDALPIYVDHSDGRMGLVLQRQVGGEWLPFVERPACECLSCDLVCSGCVCEDAPPARVMKIDPGQSFEREWSGQVQVSSTGECGSSIFTGPACLRPENPPLDEVFQVRLCWSPSSRDAQYADAGVAVPGALPKDSVLCTDKSFRVEDLVVELTPSRGAACEVHADCTGEGELCFGGACTTACPDQGLRPLGGTWRVFVAEPEMGDFFSWRREGDRQIYQGTGKLGSVRYENHTVTLQLQPSSGAAGSVSVGLPEGVAAPLKVGETLTVTVVDASTDENPENRAVLVRDAQGVLLLAAETGQRERILDDGAVAPFALTSGEEIVGCLHDECGKNLFHALRFSTPEGTVEVDPGATADLVAVGQSWRVANVANRKAPAGGCFIDRLMPWAIVNLRPGLEAP